jgi:hypothetical protein
VFGSKLKSWGHSRTRSDHRPGEGGGSVGHALSSRRGDDSDLQWRGEVGRDSELMRLE